MRALNDIDSAVYTQHSQWIFLTVKVLFWLINPYFEILKLRIG